MLVKQLKLLFIPILLCLVSSHSLYAHTKHQEIQVKTTFQVDQQQRLNAVKMVWLYDTFSSDDMLSHEQNLNKLAKILVSDLTRFSFFTRMTADDRVLVMNRLAEYKLTEAKDSDNNRALQLSITLKLNKPISIKSFKTININHADPTERSLFYYNSAKDINFTNELKTSCSAKVEEKTEFVEGQFPQIASITCQN